MKYWELKPKSIKAEFDFLMTQRKPQTKIKVRDYVEGEDISDDLVKTADTWLLDECNHKYRWGACILCGKEVT